MLPDGLQALMVLQDRDLKKSQLDKVLAGIPRERAAVEARIATHRAAIDAAKKTVTDRELQRKELEITLRSLEEQIQRYRNQQLQVRKNDEYQALTHEIELAERRIGEVEEKEIKLLYELDTERAKAAEAERTLKAAIVEEESQRARLAEREKQVGAELEAAQAEVDAARSGVRENLLPRYDHLRRYVGLPLVVPLHGGKCGGCHLKVSSGVESEARKGTEIVSCDNCSRIVFFEF
ncbi:MAG TPA: C4-type zinc ribbon domain-containing protein [Opitutaceae bacterium]